MRVARRKKVEIRKISAQQRVRCANIYNARIKIQLHSAEGTRITKHGGGGFINHLGSHKYNTFCSAPEAATASCRRASAAHQSLRRRSGR